MAAHGRPCVGRGRGWGILLGAWQLAAFRVSEGLDPKLDRFASDTGNLAFANAWVALGSFAIAADWAALSCRLLLLWLGVWAMAVGVGLVVAQAVWTSPGWILRMRRSGSGSSWSSAGSCRADRCLSPDLARVTARRCHRQSDYGQRRRAAAESGHIRLVQGIESNNHRSADTST